MGDWWGKARRLTPEEIAGLYGGLACVPEVVWFGGHARCVACDRDFRQLYPLWCDVPDHAMLEKIAHDRSAPPYCTDCHHARTRRMFARVREAKRGI